jgi:hypothetical protein
MGLTVTLAGQDITDWVDEFSIDIESALPSGAGTSAGGAGQSATCEFVADIGPAASAVGAGSAVSTTPYEDVVKADNPLVYIPGYDLLGTQATDVSGNARHGTYTSSPTKGQAAIVTGEPGYSVEFAGGGYIDIPAGALPTGGGPVTLETWYLCEGQVASGNHWAALMSLGDSASIHDFSILHGNVDHVWTGSWNNGTEHSGIFQAGGLYHVVGILDSGTAYVYINNVLVSSASDGDTITAYKMLAGKLADSTNAHGSSVATLPGRMAHIAVYSGHLSTLRIAAHYNAGIAVYAPKLVRQGELKVVDATGTTIFGGYASQFEDATDALTVKTKVTCHDYWQDLDRVQVNEVYTGRTDVYIIRDIVTKYAPWIDLSGVPATGSYTFPKRFIRAQSVREAIQKICNVTGFVVWVDPSKVMYYISATSATSAPFGLSDDPDFISLHPCDILNYEVDDNAIINRVYFYGGQKVSDDFTQDLSVQANGSNKVFLLAYYPENTGDGKVHVLKNGVELTVGSPFKTANDGAASKLISDGGTADVLIDKDAETLTFDTAPLDTDTLIAIYRYRTPLVVVLSDSDSFKFFGRYYDGKLSDKDVFDAEVAISRCRVLLAQQSFGLTTLQVQCWKGGIQAGQLLDVANSVRDISSSFMVQKVSTKPLGSGNFEYTIDLGAWNWNLVDLLVATAREAGASDDSTDEDISIVQVNEAVEASEIVDVITTTTTTSGVYYSRSATSGDGHDAYSGFFTITS